MNIETLKRTLGGAVALAALAGPAAQAADLAAPVLPAPPPVFTWTGGYIGVSAGAAFLRNRNTGFAPGTITLPVGAGAVGSPFIGSALTAGGVASTPSLTPFTVVGAGLPVATVLPLGGGCTNCRSRETTGILGAQWGYNWQFGVGSGFVIGYEGDLQTSGLGRNGNTQPIVVGTQVTTPAVFGVPALPLVGTPGAPVLLGPNTFTFFDPRVAKASMPDWFGTTRIRVGYAFDRFLVFATGGLAYGGGFASSSSTVVITHTGPLVVPNGSCWRTDRCESVRYGWALGGGFQYAVTNNLSAKLEGLYADLGRRSDGFASPTNVPYALQTGPAFAGSPGDRVLYSGPPTAFSPRADRLRSSFVVLRAGLNYKFSGF